MSEELSKKTALLDDPEFIPQDDTLIDPRKLGEFTDASELKPQDDPNRLSNFMDDMSAEIIDAPDVASQLPIITYRTVKQQVVPALIVQREEPPPVVQRKNPPALSPMQREEPSPPPPPIMRHVVSSHIVQHEEPPPPPPPPAQRKESPPMTNGSAHPTELRKRRTPQYAPTPEPTFDKPKPIAPKKPVRSIKLVAIALLIIAIVWWGVIPLIWSTSVTELNLVHRLPYDSCFSVSVEAWKNGSMLNHDMKYLVDTLHKFIKKHDFQGLASSHVGVPVCLMTWKGHDDVFVTALNLRIIGRSTSSMRTTEQSSLCPELQNIYTERNKLIVVQYNRIDDYEEMERELSGAQADIVQQIFDAQNGINICH